MEELISVKDLSVYFGERPVLLDINLEIYQGEVFAIIGGSGSGKSTLLKVITGLLMPSRGKVLIKGKDITTYDQGGQERGEFGILFQNSGLIGSMTVLENVMLPLLHHTTLPYEVIEVISKARLMMVGLQGAEGLYPSELSGGMRKRAGLARALALNPEVLFLDEPSSGLDPIASAALDELILDINRTTNTTIVVVTHDLDSIFKIAHRAILLEGSKKGIVAEGRPETIKEQAKDPFVLAFFNRRPLGKVP